MSFEVETRNNFWPARKAFELSSTCFLLVPMFDLCGKWSFEAGNFKFNQLLLITCFWLKCKKFLSVEQLLANNAQVHSKI